MSKMKERRSSPTIDEIAEAALGVLSSEGPKALSLRRIGEVLGTHHVAIFRRCGSFDGLLDVCADYIASGFPAIPDTLDWVAATQMRFEAAYDMWAEHADLIMLMSGRAWLGKSMTSRFYEPAMRSLIDSGMTSREAVTLFSILYRLTIGSVVSNKANHWTPWESRRALEKLGVENFPTLAKVEFEVEKPDSKISIREAIKRLLADTSALRAVSPDT